VLHSFAKSWALVCTLACASGPPSDPVSTIFHPHHGLPCAELGEEERKWPIERVNPRYPESAEAAGSAGFSELSFKLDSTGRPVEVEVLRSEPAGVFDLAAVHALREWRYCPPLPATSAEPSVVRFDFAVEETVLQ
jgi:TonB family protein